MKSLFDENHKYTREALTLDHETVQAIAPIFQKYMNRGLSPREISHIMQGAVVEEELQTIVFKDVNAINTKAPSSEAPDQNG